MPKTFRTIKRSAGTPSVSRSKLSAAARSVVARSVVARRGVPRRPVAPTGGSAAPAPAAALHTAVSAAIHAPSVIRAPEPAASR